MVIRGVVHHAVFSFVSATAPRAFRESIPRRSHHAGFLRHQSIEGLASNTRRSSRRWDIPSGKNRTKKSPYIELEFETDGRNTLIRKVFANDRSLPLLQPHIIRRATPASKAALYVLPVTSRRVANRRDRLTSRRRRCQAGQAPRLHVKEAFPRS